MSSEMSSHYFQDLVNEANFESEWRNSPSLEWPNLKMFIRYRCLSDNLKSDELSRKFIKFGVHWKENPNVCYLIENKNLILSSLNSQTSFQLDLINAKNIYRNVREFQIFVALVSWDVETYRNNSEKYSSVIAKIFHYLCFCFPSNSHLKELFSQQI